MHQILEMSKIVYFYRKDLILSTAVAAMTKTFQKYWSEIPLLYVLGWIVDPMIKLNGLKTFLNFIGHHLDLDLITQHFTNMQSKLFEVYRLYECRFGGINT